MRRLNALSDQVDSARCFGHLSRLADALTPYRRSGLADRRRVAGAVGAPEQRYRAGELIRVDLLGNLFWSHRRLNRRR
jgi:hypothetical protein